MSGLNELERTCLHRYLDLLRERLGDALVRVVMFGSAARGDMWPSHSPMHSDIDLPRTRPTSGHDGSSARSRKTPGRCGHAR
jgi:hypothetical protein